MNIIVDSELMKLGVFTMSAVIKGVRVSNRSEVLEKLKKEVIGQVHSLDLEPVFNGYRNVYAHFNQSSVLPPAESLRLLVKKTGRLPNVNTIVDSYNLIVFKTGLSIGSHDLQKIEGHLQLRHTDGQEKYTPLGSTSAAKIGAGEYACLDREKVICRMDIKQCDETKITKKTIDVFIYIQGNESTSRDYVRQALHEATSIITTICGGTLISA